jgi:predicted kinase
MKKVILFRGLPGCGKSTRAKAMIDAHPGKYKRVNKDDLRAMLDNGHHTSGNEKFVLRIRDQIILQSLAEGKHVLVDDTNIHPKHEARIRQLVLGQAEVELIDMMDVDLDTCIARDLARPNSVGPGVIRRMWAEYLEWKKPDLNQDTSLPRAIICDLDGTLALLNDRSPYDAAKCDQDFLNEPVADIVRRYHEGGHRIVFLSGREDKFREPTVRFLEKYLGTDFRYTLLMRVSGDMRKDSIIKEEILRASILPHYHVDFALDDRNQVVDMWRGLGLTCLQVDYGDF